MSNTFLNKKFSNDRYLGVTKWLILINFAFYLIYVFGVYSRFSLPIFSNILNMTIFRTDLILRGKHIWTIFTYPFISTSFISFLFNSFFLFYFGTRYEIELGSKEFLFLYFSSSFFAGAVALFITFVFNFPIFFFGNSASLFALLFAFSILHRYERIILFFFINVKLPMAVLILLLIDYLFLYFGIGNIYEAILDFLGFVYAILYMNFRVKVNISQFFRNLF